MWKYCLVALLGALNLMAVPAHWIEARNIRLVETIRISETEVDLIFRVDAYNNDTQPATNVVASVRSITFNSAILSQVVLFFPDIPPFGQVTSRNTFSVRQRLSAQFSENLLRFFFEIGEAACQINGQTVAGGAVNSSNPCQICVPGANPTGWTNVPAGTSCNDGNSCTSGDVCNGNGVCGGAPVPVDDRNACTIDSCSAGVVTHTPISCDDNNACTIDICDTVRGCVNTPMVCDDNNVCTTDRCDSTTGKCVFTRNDSIVCDTCANPGNACDLSYREPVSNNCVVQAQTCSPHPLKMPLEFEGGAPKLNLCLSLDTTQGTLLDPLCDPNVTTCQRSGCGAESAACAYAAKVCLSDTQGVGMCNPDTGGCVFGGREELPTTTSLVVSKPVAAVPTVNGCQEVIDGRAEDKCARLTERHPESIYACVNDACVARARQSSDACVAQDPCLEAHRSAEGACTFAPRDCGAEFGNDVRFTYACQVDRSGSLPQAVCTRAAKCEIGGRLLADGTPNPENGCEVCDAAVNPTGWSNRPELSACFAGAGVAGVCRVAGVSTLAGFSGLKASCQ
ncbi:MAG: hypothetical protein K2X03_17250 [Bryobacteraceae bacterium]|nr:hypothetical protein [Bryobacteraceae bacterium]